MQPGEESWGIGRLVDLGLGRQEPYHHVLDLVSFGIGCCLVDSPSVVVAGCIEE